MILEDYNQNEITDFINNLENENYITSKEQSFKNWFSVDKENIKVLEDSLIIISNDNIEKYEDTGNSIIGIPLFDLVSFKDINDINSEHVKLNIKIPYKLELMYSQKIDDFPKYTFFYIESMSDLFKSNMSEQNVDNSYQAVKELLDGKFNLLRELNYEELPFTISDICTKNGIKGFQLLVYELMVMGLSRELNDVTTEYRYTAKNKSPYDKFQMINVRDISRNASAFSALASENISKSLLSALRNSKKDKNEIMTPQEQIGLGRY